MHYLFANLITLRPYFCDPYFNSVWSGNSTSLGERGGGSLIILMCLSALVEIPFPIFRCNFFVENKLTELGLKSEKTYLFYHYKDLFFKAYVSFFASNKWMCPFFICSILNYFFIVQNLGWTKVSLTPTSNCLRTN